jgi:hypothetical protein
MKSYTEVVEAIKATHPTFQVRSYLDHWFFRFLWRCGWRMGATTVYTTVYMDPALIGSLSGASILRHERVHIDDMVRHPIWFIVSYFLLPPIGPGMRAYWEWRGYQEDLKESIERLGRINPYMIDWVVQQFTGSSYLWMYPFRRRMEQRCQDFCRTYLASIRVA